jgi:putative membrane protein
MKKSNAITKLISATLIGASLIVAACGENNQQEDPKDVAEEINEARIDSNQNEKDAQFLVDAADINLEEIRLAQLAQQMGKSADIKDMGKMMETEHTASLNELKSLANQESIVIPTTTDNAEEAYQKLKNKAPEDFDKEFCDMMVNGHQDAISLFEKASTDATDPDIQAWATATLPALRKHLDHAKMCQKKLEKK